MVTPLRQTSNCTPSAKPVSAMMTCPTIDKTTPANSQLITVGDPARDIPPCQECHGPGPRQRDARYPRLAGQPAAYLRLQLTLFADGRRGGSSYGGIMRAIARRLTPAQIDDAANAYAALERP